MYFPEGLKERLRGPGSSFPIGVGALSLIFAAIASGWLGIAIVLGALFVLFGIELYREAAKLTGDKGELRAELAEAKDDVSRVKQLEERNIDLERVVTELRNRNREPSIGLEGLLGSIASQLEYIQLAKTHRAIAGQAGEAPVTKFEIQSNEEVVVASAVSTQAALLDGQLVALVESETTRDIAIGPVLESTSQGLRASFDISFLPIDLAEDLETQGAVTPTGYVVQPAGLFLNHYGKLTDDQLDELERSLTSSHATVLGALSSAGEDKGLHKQRLPQEDPSALRAEPVVIESAAQSDASTDQVMETEND